MAFASVILTGAGVLWMQSVAEATYHPPVGRIRFANTGPDSKVGTAPPRWLSEIAAPGSLVVAISCASCSAHDVLPGLSGLPSRGSIVVLAQSATKAEIRILRTRFPSLRFVPVPESPVGLNLSITPKLYAIDPRGKFSYVQNEYLQHDEFLSQFRRLTR